MTDAMRPLKRLSGTVFTGEIRDPAEKKAQATVLSLMDVLPGSQVEILNLSRQPNSTVDDFESRGIRLPVVFPGAGDQATHQKVLIGDEASKKIGLQPGDVLWVRQVRNGKASEPAVIRNRESGYDSQRQHRVTAYNTGAPAAHVGWVDGKLQRVPDVTGGMNLGGSWISGTPDRDNRPVTVLKDRIKVKDLPNGHKVVTGDKAIEPGALVTLTVMRTGQTARVEVDSHGRFTADIVAEPQDQIDIRAFEPIAPYIPES